MDNDTLHLVRYSILRQEQSLGGARCTGPRRAFNTLLAARRTTGFAGRDLWDRLRSSVAQQERHHRRPMVHMRRALAAGGGVGDDDDGSDDGRCRNELRTGQELFQYSDFPNCARIRQAYGDLNARLQNLHFSFSDDEYHIRSHMHVQDEHLHLSGEISSTQKLLLVSMEATPFDWVEAYVENIDASHGHVICGNLFMHNNNQISFLRKTIFPTSSVPTEERRRRAKQIMDRIGNHTCMFVFGMRGDYPNDGYDKCCALSASMDLCHEMLQTNPQFMSRGLLPRMKENLRSYLAQPVDELCSLAVDYIKQIATFGYTGDERRQASGTVGMKALVGVGLAALAMLAGRTFDSPGSPGMDGEVAQAARLHHTHRGGHTALGLFVDPPHGPAFNTTQFEQRSGTGPQSVMPQNTTRLSAARDNIQRIQHFSSELYDTMRQPEADLKQSAAAVLTLLDLHQDLSSLISDIDELDSAQTDSVFERSVELYRSIAAEEHTVDTVEQNADILLDKQYSIIHDLLCVVKSRINAINEIDKHIDLRLRGPRSRVKKGLSDELSKRKTQLDKVEAMERETFNKIEALKLERFKEVVKQYREIKPEQSLYQKFMTKLKDTTRTFTNQLITSYKVTRSQSRLTSKTEIFQHVKNNFDAPHAGTHLGLYRPEIWA